VVILYLRDRTPGEAETEAPVIPPQTITDTPYYDITITPTVTLTATPTPDNAPHGKIVYSCQVDRQTSHDQICLMNADGTNNRQLTDNLKAIHFYPSLSPDGNSIVFISSRAGGFEIFEMQIDGSNLRQLTSGIGECYAPEISPDGSKIVFTRFSGGRNTISVINRDGSGLTDLNNYLDCKDPTWSPDGSQILFIASPSQVPQFFVMNADGSNPHQVTDISACAVAAIGA
jgi:Tol biopolymer transport system component